MSGPVSVVIASRAPVAALDACLASVEDQAARHDAEIVVARAGAMDALADRHPGVRFLPAPSETNVPRLRALGLAATTGDLVAVTEDHCVVAADWLDRLIAGADGADVVGGAMDNARSDRATDWAAYFAEYGFFAGRGAGAGPPAVTGANVAYRRPVVGRVAALAGAGEWENVIHARLGAAGSRFAFVEQAAVSVNVSHGVVEFCRDRFEHGYDYARRRLMDEPSARWMLLAGFWVLPFLLTFRIAQVIAPRHRAPFLRALPLTFLFFAAWAVGEAAGYLRGPSAGSPDHG